jgi:hypothetical protein
MSKVLGNLVARSLGDAHTFRPRTPSLFEPVHPVHSLAPPAKRFGEAGEPVPEEMELEAEHGTSASPQKQDRKPQPPEPQMIAAQFPENTASFQDMRSYRLDLPLVDAEQSEPTSSLREQFFSQHRQPPAAQPFSVTPLLHADAHRAERDDPHAARRLESPVEMNPGKPKPEKLSQESAAPALPLAALDRRSSGQTEIQPSALVSFMPERQAKISAESTPVVPVNRRARQRDFLPAPQAAEPVVHVTIGRIEIRAEHEPAAGKRNERASTPVMGLEEYLRRKNVRARE